MVWVLRFATELHRLRPLTPGPEAAAIAAKSFKAGRDTLPERAAQIHAELLPPSNPDAAMSAQADA